MSVADIWFSFQLLLIIQSISHIQKISFRIVVAKQRCDTQNAFPRAALQRHFQQLAERNAPDHRNVEHEVVTIDSSSDEDTSTRENFIHNLKREMDSDSQGDDIILAANNASDFVEDQVNGTSVPTGSGSLPVNISKVIETTSSPIACELAKEMSQEKIGSPSVTPTYNCFGCNNPLHRRTSSKLGSKGREFYGCNWQSTVKCKAFAFWAPGSGRKRILNTSEVNAGTSIIKRISLAELNIGIQYLRHQFPDLSGLKPCVVALQENSFDQVDPGKDYVQVLCDNKGGFFVLIISKGTENPIVYDFCVSNHTTLPSFIETQIASIIHTSNEMITFTRPPCEQISNNAAAPALALAMTTNFAHHRVISGQNFFDIDDVKAHALECLNLKKMTVFPNVSLPPKRSRRQSHNESIAVYCTCRLPEHYGDMIQCDDCESYFHMKCVQMPSTWKDDDPWACDQCCAVAMNNMSKYI